MSKIGAVVQARMGSSRLPGKVMKQVLGRPLLAYLLERIGPAAKLDEIIIATSTEPADSQIADFAAGAGVTTFRGSESDVLDRYYRAAELRSLDYVVRITADCPLLDSNILNWFIGQFLAQSELDYMSTSPTFPEGYDMEIFRFSALERAWNEATKDSEREHVTPYIRENPEIFNVRRIDCPYGDLSDIRITVDEEVDFEVVKAIIEHFHPVDPHFKLDDIVDYLKNQRADLIELNQHVARNDGYKRSLAEEE